MLRFSSQPAVELPVAAPAWDGPGIEATLLTTVSLFASVANFSLVCAIATCVRSCQPLQMFTAALACVDFFTAVVYIPSYNFFVLTPNRSYSPAFCQGVQPAFLVAAGLSASFRMLMSLSIHRLSSAESATDSRSRQRRFPLALAGCLAALLVNSGVVFTLPAALGSATPRFFPDNGVCSFSFANEADGGWNGSEREPDKPRSTLRQLQLRSGVSYLWRLACLGMLTCQSALTVFYLCHVTSAVTRGEREFNKIQEAAVAAKQPHFRRARRVLLALLIGHSCWLPLLLVTMMDTDLRLSPRWLQRLAVHLALLSCLANPAMSVLALRSVREAYAAFISCRCPQLAGSGQFAGGDSPPAPEGRSPVEGRRCGQMPRRRRQRRRRRQQEAATQQAAADCHSKTTVQIQEAGV